MTAKYTLTQVQLVVVFAALEGNMSFADYFDGKFFRNIQE